MSTNNNQPQSSVTDVSDKTINPMSGWPVLFILIILFLVSVGGIIFSAVSLENKAIAVALGVTIIVACIVGIIAFLILVSGFRVINPNEALVLTLFGKYYGTISKPGFFYINPFCTGNNPAYAAAVAASASQISIQSVSKKISLKALTLNNEKQKVNDLDGNPIEIGVIVIWRVVDAAKAVFNVDNYKTFISTQCDSAIRQVARTYPYDVSADGDEKSLRGSSVEIAENLKAELQMRTGFAGIEIMEARISHLAYAPEIAAAMLQRQQASAIIAARQKIVEGAVGMVEMALNTLSENKVVELDAERKAQMVSNLLVVLCGNKDAQPIVNSGSIF